MWHVDFPNSAASRSLRIHRGSCRCGEKIFRNPRQMLQPKTYLWESRCKTSHLHGSLSEVCRKQTSSRSSICRLSETSGWRYACFYVIFYILMYLHCVCMSKYICYNMQKTMWWTWNKREQLVELGTFLSPCGSWDRTQVVGLVTSALIHWSISLTSSDQFLKWGSLHMNNGKIGHKCTNEKLLSCDSFNANLTQSKIT